MVKLEYFSYSATISFDCRLLCVPAGYQADAADINELHSKIDVKKHHEQKPERSELEMQCRTQPSLGRAHLHPEVGRVLRLQLGHYLALAFIASSGICRIKTPRQLGLLQPCSMSKLSQALAGETTPLFDFLRAVFALETDE